jgi:hypothetical protein
MSRMNEQSIEEEQRRNDSGYDLAEAQAWEDTMKQTETWYEKNRRLLNEIEALNLQGFSLSDLFEKEFKGERK